MSDELTPAEKDAIDRLPRERVPAGLEGRVVGAMRERGFLAKPRRVIVLSGGRAAGLLAACVALVIGAYAIGLQRGDGDAVRPTTLPAPEAARPDGGGRLAPPRAAFEGEAAPGEAPAKDRALADEGKASGPGEASRQEAPAPATPAAPEQTAPVGAASNEAHKKSVASDAEDVAEFVRMETPAPAAGLAQSARRQESATPDVADIPLAFILGGTPLIVEAPDSVRVTQDEQGRMLIIHTSDGIIRIRIADGR